MTEMLEFLKAVTSADRLRIVGVLTRRRASRAEIAAQLDLPLREVVDHLAFLEHAGVINLVGDVYELKPDMLSMLARDQFSQGTPACVPGPDLDEKSRKVLKAYLNPDGSIKQIPNQPAKLQVIMDYLLQAFTPGTDYTEKEVNGILHRFNADTARLRRDLVDAGLLARESDGSRYWRVEGGTS